jgi:hypothetical protein
LTKHLTQEQDAHSDAAYCTHCSRTAQNQRVNEQLKAGNAAMGGNDNSTWSCQQADERDAQKITNRQKNMDISLP